jgi:hypothetical protein
MEGQAHIFSSEWWLTVVLVGLGIHLAASYLKPHLDKVGGRLSRSWATRTALRAHERSVRIEQLRGSEAKRLLAAQKEIRYRLQALAVLMFAMLLGMTLVYLRLLPTVYPLPFHYRFAVALNTALLAVALFAVVNIHIRVASIADELSEALDTPTNDEGIKDLVR